MSYTRTYNRTISEKISKRLAVSYSLDSKGGLNRISVEIDNKTHTFSGNGSKNIDINAQIPVTIDINVDTKPFDKSVDNCNTNVNLLTGAVVATEAAQVASIKQNSEKVAGTIVSGFFSYIKSEISQQITELSQNMDAQLMHLRELSQACVDKKRQMDSDFNRISSRYIKIFDDLNHELHNRVYELDKPTFVFRKELDNQQIRSIQNDLVNVVSVAGKEGSQLLSKLSVSVAKKRALDTITQMKIFLWQQKHLNRIILRSKINESIEAKQYTPVCFIEMKDGQNQINKQVHCPNYFPSLKDHDMNQRILDQFSENKSIWQEGNEESTEQIKTHFSRTLNENYQELDSHSARVKNMIQKLANLNQIETLIY